ncbi:MAG: hypothetical protein N3G21_09530 [Candidatus Hydrogenedentes bacterium]|nr:hypothetical protein [Candidatus Hydrogenedentota bacterium]
MRYTLVSEYLFLIKGKTTFIREVSFSLKRYYDFPKILVFLSLIIFSDYLSYGAEKIKYPLKIEMEGEGTVIPGVGTFYYDSGTTVYFNALPSENYAFSSWQGDYQSTSWFGSILMNGPKTVRAVFVPADWRLTLTHSGDAIGFTYPPPGIYGFTDGQQVGISVGTSEGVYFGGWSGDLDSNPHYSEFVMLTMNSDKSLDARFTSTGYVLNVYVVGDGGVTPGPMANPHRYSEGLLISLMAYQTNPMWRFDHWSGDIDENEPQYYILYSILMDRDRVITAHFIEKPYYKLILEIQGLGSVSMIQGFENPVVITSGLHEFNFIEWTFIRCEAINSEPGWIFDHWEGDFGDTLPTYHRCSFSMDMNRYVRVVFSELPTLEGEGIYEEGEGMGTEEGEGLIEGSSEGLSEGTLEGTIEGVIEGSEEGISLEGEEGTIEGLPEGEGFEEGEAEGEVCLWSEQCPNFSFQGVRYGNLFGVTWGACDSNNSGIPDEWEIEIVKNLLCYPTGKWEDMFICAYVNNYETLKTEPRFHTSYYPFRHILAGLLTIGENIELLAYLLMLEKTYTPFRLSEGILPLASYEDADIDGVSNYEEYLFTLSYGGDKSIFLQNLFNPVPVPDFQSTDTNQNYKIELAELLRIIQFFNSSGFHCEEGTEDGYAPGYDGYDNFSCGLHTADYYPPNWHISIEEVLRAIQFFNAVGYFVCPFMSEDHYCMLGLTL